MAATKKNKIMTRKATKYLPYYIFFIPALTFLVLFSYVPMTGLVLAFKEYYPRFGIYQSPYATPIFKWFTKLFEDPYFWTVFKNTIVISLLKMVIGWPFPIMLALFYNELKSPRFGKFVQTVLFIPNFLSWVVVAGLLRMIFSNDGFVNSIIMFFGGETVKFLTHNGPFLALIILSDVWKGGGYGMIIYLAAITGVDQSLYEAVEIDGGNRWHKMWHITLPGIAPTISIQFILGLPSILGGSFDQIYNLYSVPVYEVADTLDTYLYRVGLSSGQVELGTALGLSKAVVGLLLVLAGNWTAKRIGGEGIW